jgi:hypothetical protein
MKTDNNIDLFALTDQFIADELDGNADGVQSKNEFLIYYLSSHIKPYVDKDDIEMLNDIFQQYVYICAKYNIIPSVRMYCILISMNHQMFNDIINGVNVSPKFTEWAKSLLDICQTFVENKLSNTDKTNINLMFISKAVYGYTETSPIQRIEKIDIQVNDIKSITNRYGNIKAIECDDN